MNKLMRDAKAVVQTASRRDWLMSDISADRSYLGLTSLDWLASESEAPLCTTEYLDSTSGYWWFVWVLYRTDLHASIEGLGEILRLAQEQPGRFGASAKMVTAVHDWDRGCGEADFDIPDPSGDGDDPTYVLSAIFTFRRLLNIARSQELIVVHMRYSFRPSVEA